MLKQQQENSIFKHTPNETQKKKQHRQKIIEEIGFNAEIKQYTGFSNNTFTIMYYVKIIQTFFLFYILQKKKYKQPISIVIVWIFYDENQMPVSWNITKEGLVFYFLFNILIIPFQILIDVLYL